MLQEQNRQGKFDNSIGHHLLLPGQQPRKHPRRGQWGIKTRKTVGITRSKTCHHPASKRDCSSQSSYLQGVKESGAGSSRQETQETTLDRNLQVQPKLALSYKGQPIQLHFEATPETEPNTFTTEEARPRLIAPGRQESMRFEQALTLSRRAVKLQRQAGQTNTGMDNSTPGSTRQRWKIEMDQAPTIDRNLGFVCSLVHSVGFTPATHEQIANSPEGAPLSSMNLENVIFTDNPTITKAIEHLKLTATYNDGDRTKLIPRVQALTNRFKTKWRELQLPRNQKPTDLNKAC